MSRNALGGPHGGGLHPRPDRSRQGRRRGVAYREDQRSHPSGGRHRPRRRYRARSGRQRRRTRPAGRHAHPVRARYHQDAHLPRGAHLSSSAASGALYGPRPSAAAPRRSDGVSTSRRSPGMSSGPSSTAPPAACRARDARPNAGRNATPGVAVYSVVPSPAASATKAVGQAAAARNARPSSAGRSAGRSADSAAVPESGHRPAAYAAPCRSAALRPSRGSSGTTSAPRPASVTPATWSSVITITRAAWSHASAAVTVSQARARASSPRRGPASPASRDLAWASTLTGITTDQVVRALSAIKLILPRHLT